MGYTHLWTRKGDISDNVWDKIENAIGWAIQNAPEHAATAGGYPLEVEYKFVLNGIRCIVIDGVGYFRCEPFYVTQKYSPFADISNLPWTFCKTNHNPYDLLVVAALHIMHHYAPQNVLPRWPGYDPNVIDPTKSESKLTDLADGIALGNLAIAAMESETPDKVTLKMRHAINKYVFDIGEEGFAALSNYDSQADGCQQSLESQIMQIDEITFAAVEFSDGQFGDDLNDCFALSLYAEEATPENLNKIRLLVERVMTNSLQWYAKLEE